MRYLEYKEQLTHGSFEFPFAFYSVSPIHPRYNMVEHWHKECELIRVVSGRLMLTLDGERTMARPGELFFLSAGALHSGQPEACTYECLLFDLNAILEGNPLCKREMAPVLRGERRIRFCFPPEEEKIHQIAAGLMDTIQARHPGYPLRMLGGMYDLLALVAQEGHYEPQGGPVPAASVRRLALFKDVLSLIRSRYAEPLTLEELAASAHMNKRYFCRVFKAMSGRTPIEFLNYYRVESACEQLAATDKTVAEVAFACGFSDASYFVKVFKRHKGLTPTEYLRTLGGTGNAFAERDLHQMDTKRSV